MKIKVGTRGTSLQHLIADRVLDPSAASRLHHMLQDHVIGFLLPGIQLSEGSSPLFWPEPRPMTKKNRQATWNNIKDDQQKHNKWTQERYNAIP